MRDTQLDRKQVNNVLHIQAPSYTFNHQASSAQPMGLVQPMQRSSSGQEHELSQFKNKGYDKYELACQVSDDSIITETDEQIRQLSQFAAHQDGQEPLTEQPKKMKGSDMLR